MRLIVIGALLGLVIGGPRGLVIGAVVGWVLGWLVPKLVRSGLQRMQSQFLDSTFALMGALSKADSVVTRDEIRSAEGIFARLRLSPEQREAARASFNRGKQPDFDLDTEVDRLRHAIRGRAFLVQIFLQIELMAIAADGRIHPTEHQMLVRIARGLGLGEPDVAQLEALLRAAAAGGAGSSTGTAPGPAALEDAYAALGVEASASEAEIKRAYRRLVSQNHPDKLAGKGLPDSMRELAEERTRELNAAYDLIKEARGFV